MFDLPTLNHTYNLKVSKLKLQVQEAVSTMKDQVEELLVFIYNLLYILLFFTVDFRYPFVKHICKVSND